MDLHVVSHNLNGARGLHKLSGVQKDYGKLETVALKMQSGNIDVYLLQETWLLNGWTVNSHGCTIIHHGPWERPST